MSSSIFKDLAAIRERQEREDRLVDEMFAREEERIERERPWSPAEIIWQSEWYQGFGEEAQEFIGLDEGKYYWAFTRSPAEDEEYLSWDGPYDSREAAEEALNERLERWRDIRGEIEDAYQEQQIAEFTRTKSGDLKEEIKALDRDLEFNATKRAEELRGYLGIDQSKVSDIIRLEAMELKAQRERLCNQLRGLSAEVGLGQEIALEH